MIVAYRGSPEIGRAIVRPGDTVKVPFRKCNAVGECRQEIILIPDDTGDGPKPNSLDDVLRADAILAQAVDSGVTTAITSRADGSFDIVAAPVNTLPIGVGETTLGIPAATTFATPGGRGPDLYGCADTRSHASHWHACYARWADNTRTHLGNYVEILGAGAPFFGNWWNDSMVLGGQAYSITAGAGRQIWTADPVGTVVDHDSSCHLFEINIPHWAAARCSKTSSNLCPSRVDVAWSNSAYATVWKGSSHQGREAKGVSRFAIPLHTGSGFQFGVWVW